MVRAESILAELRRMGVAVNRLQADSRRVAPGDVFLAYPGAAADGRRYIAQAVAAGAAAVLYEPGGAPVAAGTVPMLPVEGLKDLAGFLADQVEGTPSAQMRVMGVTGTNGKTTVSQWLAQAWALSGLRCGVIGTLGSGFPGSLEEGLNTTPDALLVHRTLAQFRRDGAGAAAMEVSSIGLDQGRVNGVRFAVAVYTNLSRDHLEYHGSMESYGLAKAVLFRWPGLEAAVINADDGYAPTILAGARESGARILAYSVQPGNPALADYPAVLLAESVAFGGAGVRLQVRLAEEVVAVTSPVVGMFNVSNLLAVIATLVVSGVGLARAAELVSALRPPAGRMETLGGEGQPLAVVDYAHTPDALDKVLTTLRHVAESRGGRLVAVFGCGGNRDPGKRPLMGETVSRLADVAVVTSDNPRHEDPAAIVADVVRGMSGHHQVVIDRSTAIRWAIANAAGNDVILVAGKGHEPYQEVMGVRHPFSDQHVVARALSDWRATRAC